VLCEKPLAVGRAEAEAMFEAARHSGTVLIEAYPYWFQPHFVALKEVLASGVIGDVRSVQASFGFTVGNPATNIRLKPELGGGALLDAGSYPLSLIRAVMGSRPARVVATSTKTDSGVDMSTMALLEFADGRRAQMSCAMDGATHRHATIVGSKGTLYTEYLNHTSENEAGNTFGYLPNIMWIRRGVAQTVPFERVQAPVGSGFRFAAETFARAIRSNQPQPHVDEMALASVDIAASLEAISESASTGRPVELPVAGA
jgi:predicted dehydrogenase